MVMTMLNVDNDGETPNATYRCIYKRMHAYTDMQFFILFHLTEEV